MNRQPLTRWFKPTRYGPIGVDIGARSVKLVQFDAAAQRVVAASRWDLPPVESDTEPPTPEQQLARWAEALRHARDQERFHGREAVLTLSGNALRVQNLRLGKLPAAEARQQVVQEVAGRLPFPMAEAEIRCLESAQVRQGANMLQEVLVLAARKADIETLLEASELGGLRPIAIDVEPAAIARSGMAQHQREDDRGQRVLCLHVGYSRTTIVICEGARLLFIKYLDLGGRALDRAFAQALEMGLTEASAMRRHNAQRRRDDQDRELARTIAAAERPVVEELCRELRMCIRYHSVTFRGKPLALMLLGGGEANPSLQQALEAHCELECRLSQPFRHFEKPAGTWLQNEAPWEVAAGLALRGLLPETAAPERSAPPERTSLPTASAEAKPQEATT